MDPAYVSHSVVHTGVRIHDKPTSCELAISYKHQNCGLAVKSCVFLLNTVNNNSVKLLPNLAEHSLLQSCDRITGFTATKFEFGGFVIDQSWHADTGVD